MLFCYKRDNYDIFIFIYWNVLLIYKIEGKLFEDIKYYIKIYIFKLRVNLFRKKV